jgi:CRP/FNR family transcriptional regulator, anaerobic regulatory protein
MDEPEKRMKMLQSKNASTKYRHFLKQFPSIANRARLRDIASFLGMSQEHLSRIRSGEK